MGKILEERDDVQFVEPVVPQKDVKMKVGFAEAAKWKSKVDGAEYEAIKLTLSIDDASVRTQHADAKPRRTIEDQFNLVRYPYADKNTGETKWMNRNKLFEIETAFGFEPSFVDGSGNQIEAYVTKNGNKVAPKVEGVKRILNQDFFDAYFTEDGTPKMENWAEKVVYADIDLQTSEKFGDKNVISRYKKAPLV